MVNFTVNGNFTSELNHTSTYKTWLTGVFAFLFSLNIFLSITATLGNTVILVALHKDSSLHLPSKLLFLCLAVTDLFVGLIPQPLFATVIFHVSRMKRINQEILYYDHKGNNVSSYILCTVSILTSTAISVDRLLALLLALRYRHVVTSKRVLAVIVSFWLIAISCGLVRLWSHRIPETASMVFGSMSLIASFFSYTKIHLKLRQHQAQVQDHGNQGQPNGGGIPLDITRYKKTVSSIAWVQLALVACYTPFLIVSILLTVFSFSEIIYVMRLSTATLIYLNSSLNPILYCWKIREVRQSVKDTIRQFRSLCN